MARTLIRLLLLATLSLAGPRLASAPGSVWTSLAVDPKGDARTPARADAAQLSYQYDHPHDVIWLRLALFSQLTVKDFTIDIAIDLTIDSNTAAAPQRTMWWGTNVNFAFDRLLHVRVSTRDDGYQAAAEIRDMTGAASAGARTPVEADVRVTPEAILIGFQREAVLGSSMKMHVIVGLGSGDALGDTLEGTLEDDIPNVGSAAIDLTLPRPARGLREIDVSRDNLRFAPDQPILSETSSPLITRHGHGRKTLVLIPGVYSGGEAFSGFMARNASAYTFHVVTPPGLDGTRPRALPAQESSVGEFTWTRRLTRDVRALIVRKHLDRPILVTHGFPGTLVAEELAASDPQLVGGVVEIASMAPQFFPAPGDRTRQATAAERVTVVNESWIPLWFKYVTPETWETNNYPAEMFANDPRLAERVHRQVESAALPVKVRYLVENMATDRRINLEKLGVPVLAMIPAFNDSLLANPLFAWFKTSFQDGWESLPQNDHLERLTLPAARALILDDQPDLADGAIARFVERARANTPRR